MKTRGVLAFIALIVLVVFFALYVAKKPFVAELDSPVGPKPIETNLIIPDKTTWDNVDVQDPLTGNNTLTWNEFTVFFDDTTDTQEVRLIHTADEIVKIYFINADAKTLEASIAFPNDPEGNLRFTQVIAPDGTADGPFWTEATIPLTQQWGYQLSLHENTMAGEPWSGEAIVTLKLLK